MPGSELSKFLVSLCPDSIDVSVQAFHFFVLAGCQTCLGIPLFLFNGSLNTKRGALLIDGDSKPHRAFTIYLHFGDVDVEIQLESVSTVHCNGVN